jgi:Fur family ferric uptake transcriptional regulator
MERNTRQRIAIVKTMEQADRPLSVPEIHRLGAKILPGLAIATVYRSIKALLADKVLCEVVLPGTVVRYELPRHEHHHHFHCRRCDRVYEVEGCPGLKGMTPRGFKMEGHNLTITGLCGSCVARTG